jgi:hypothetical protein
MVSQSLRDKQYTMPGGKRAGKQAGRESHVEATACARSGPKQREQQEEVPTTLALVLPNQLGDLCDGILLFDDVIRQVGSVVALLEGDDLAHSQRTAMHNGDSTAHLSTAQQQKTGEYQTIWSTRQPQTVMSAYALMSFTTWSVAVAVSAIMGVSGKQSLIFLRFM